jgi:sugar lactone lactonase YvrE
MKAPVVLARIYPVLGFLILFCVSCSKDIEDTPAPAMTRARTNYNYDLPPEILDSIFAKEQLNAGELLDKIVKAGMFIHEGKIPPEVYNFNGSDTIGLKFNIENACIYDEKIPANINSIYGKYEESIRILKKQGGSFVADVSYASIVDAKYPQYSHGLDQGSGSGYASGNGNKFTVFYQVKNGDFNNIPYQALWIISGTVSNAPQVQRIQDVTKCFVMLQKGADPEDRVANPGAIRVFKDSVTVWNQLEVIIADFSPKEGLAGTPVTITGSGFSARAEENMVKFNNVAAPVLAATTTQLQVAVPKAAGNGPITVQVQNTTGNGNIFTYIFSYTVSTLAGTGIPGYENGEGLSEAQFQLPRGVAVDAQGNVFVGDTFNHRIRKITPAGVVSTLAGTGVQGYKNGEGLSEAQFYEPRGVAVDAQGNVYVADYGNHRIRKVTPAGVVSTLAGTGVPGYKNGASREAQFHSLRGVAVDAQGNVYVADSFNHRIRKITSAGLVSTLAGTGVPGYKNGNGLREAQFQLPRDVAVDARGNVYVGDTFNHRIRKITPAGVVSALAGTGVQGNKNGEGRGAEFYQPRGVAVDARGNVYVADSFNQSIRKITPAGVVSTLAGTGVPGYKNGDNREAQFDQPFGVAVDAHQNVYVTDSFNHRIRKMVLE